MKKGFEKETKCRMLNDARLSRRFLRNAFRDKTKVFFLKSTVRMINDRDTSFTRMVSGSFAWGLTKEGSAFWRNASSTVLCR